jgi:hypothetical protein
LREFKAIRRLTEVKEKEGKAGINYPEMEFLNINLTKDSSLLLHATHSPFYGRILKKTKLFSGFKNPYKKLGRNKKTRVYSLIAF